MASEPPRWLRAIVCATRRDRLDHRVCAVVWLSSRRLSVTTRYRLFLALAALPLIAACAAPPRSTSGGATGEQAQPRAPKVLRVAVLQEPTAIMATGGSPFK